MRYFHLFILNQICLLSLLWHAPRCKNCRVKLISNDWIDFLWVSKLFWHCDCIILLVAAQCGMPWRFVFKGHGTRWRNSLSSFLRSVRLGSLFPYPPKQFTLNNTLFYFANNALQLFQFNLVGCLQQCTAVQCHRISLDCAKNVNNINIIGKCKNAYVFWVLSEQLLKSKWNLCSLSQNYIKHPIMMRMFVPSLIHYPTHTTFGVVGILRQLWWSRCCRGLVLHICVVFKASWVKRVARLYACIEVMMAWSQASVLYTSVSTFLQRSVREFTSNIDLAFAFSQKKCASNDSGNCAMCANDASALSFLF